MSVIMTVRNEMEYLNGCLQSVLAQEYSGDVEVVIAVGPSSDGTEDFAAGLPGQDQRITVVPNPSGRTPDGLNIALAHAKHGLIARIDGHNLIEGTDYLSTAVRVLRETDAVNVGGVARPEGSTATQKAIGIAMSSPLGMGGASFRVGGDAGPAETVFPGLFQRDWIDRVGGWDPTLDRAQDWELNQRLRNAGGVVWFTPELRTIYRPRGSMRALARQFHSTGQWRRRLAEEDTSALNVRYLAPPAAVLAIAAGTAGALWWRPAALVPAIYGAAVTVGGIAISKGESLPVRLRVPAALATMHMSWGTGFLRGLKR